MTTISIALGVFFSLMFELPFSKLEKLFFWFLKEDNRNKVRENESATGKEVVFEISSHIHDEDRKA